MKHDIRTLLILIVMLIISSESVFAGSMTASFSSSYSGFKVGEEYRLHVELVDTSNGSVARNNGAALARDVTFKAKDETMKVQASLSIDKKSNGGKVLAMKAKLLKGNKTIAVLSDGSESRYRISVPVEVQKPKKTGKKTPKKPKTGSNSAGKSSGKSGKKSGKNAAKKGSQAKSAKNADKRDSMESSANKNSQNKESVTPAVPPQEPDIPLIKQPSSRLTIRSEALDGATGTHKCKARTNVVIVDVLRIEGLIPGQKYEVETELLCPGNGEGVEARSADSFSARKTAHEVKHKVSLDASRLEGKKCLVISRVKMNGEIVGDTKRTAKARRRIEFIENSNEVDLSAIRYTATRNLLIVADSFADLFDSDTSS